MRDLCSFCADQAVVCVVSPHRLPFCDRDFAAYVAGWEREEAEHAADLARWQGRWDRGERRGPFVSARPGHMAGQPCIGDQRLPTEQFAATYWECGMEWVLSNWPYLTPRHVAVAIWYEAAWSRGNTKMHRAFRRWAKRTIGKGWRYRWPEGTLPPTKADVA